MVGDLDQTEVNMPTVKQLSVIAIAMTAPEVIWMLGPWIENFGKSGLSKASVAPRTIFSSSALVHRACKSRS